MNLVEICLNSSLLLFLLISLQQWVFPIIPCRATPTDQAQRLHSFITSNFISPNNNNNINLPLSEEWPELNQEDVARDFLSSSASSSSSVYVGQQERLRKADKIVSLPDQPPGVDFDQYSGYVTVDPKAGRSLFYYFVESPHNSSSKPLILWLTGGPGCSSLGNGALLEVGPFKVKSDGKTLYKNEHAWNKVANILFLDSPAGVGYSYSNATSNYNNTGDKITAKDSHTFLVNWLQRFPHYKTRDFYIVGESFAGHFVPQLAYTILAHNTISKHTPINLKGIAIGNGLLDNDLFLKGIMEYLWAHAMISDETHAGINKYCDFAHGSYPATCSKYTSLAFLEEGPVSIGYIHNSYCNPNATKPKSPGSGYDECAGLYVRAYLNRKNVQKAFHAVRTNWTSCGTKVGFRNWKDAPRTMVPLLKQLFAKKLNIWLYSGDADALISVTTTRLVINSMKLPVVTPWRPWLSKGGQEVGGYVEEYKGLTLVTIRNAGHAPPSYQPERALTMVTSFLQGKLPPSA
ncbi:unnamed protein product [Cuscuta campestris]|uniref:Carboxypeptidase n=1 Tax=Cuscuta campestris TaxID=132261 RepID=A0A484MED4_9ASTE|nr:unnamed protein product [Cuscuta campestris]